MEVNPQICSREKEELKKFNVELETRAKREFKKLSPDVQILVIEVIDDLENDPRPPGCKKLAGIDGFRVRKGDYRILYSIDDPKHLVRIYRIGHRRDIYRKR